MNREMAWGFIRDAATLALSGNEKIAGSLLRQAGDMLDSYNLNTFAAEIRQNSCFHCGHYLDDTLDRAPQLQHAEGCPKVADPSEGKIEHNDGQRSENFERTFGPPGSAG